ncbi:hypothetical protein RchiOBHm_Chr4g0404671 [Rosa chinensis]|uniref:Uncharacterized protein n=1 Tax=Rosa chinensis TaxID=74649 RepID=A0A2P6QTV5_ROSCH|nr:hypothetical protein RchiOBHm_Chr4g0404671 [Rosa chinensis]
MLEKEPTDSGSDDDDEWFSPDAIRKRVDEFQRKFTRHEELLKNFTQAGFIFFCFRFHLNEILETMQHRQLEMLKL